MKVCTKTGQRRLLFERRTKSAITLGDGSEPHLGCDQAGAANARERRRERAQCRQEETRLAWERRTVSRQPHQAPLLVYGSGADAQPFHEEAETIDANENGCLMVLEKALTPGQRLFLTNARNQAEQECRVVHVGHRTHGRARVGVEFSTPNFWNPAGTR